jgi:hypothetical protein
MQVIRSEYAIPQRLTCSSCHHWQKAVGHPRDEVESVGRCGRFGETRAATARPRCNICWEPATAVPPVQDDMHANH